jgi:hypothetical protein
MPTALTRLRKRRVLAAAVEAVVGTPETLDAGDAVMNVFDADMQPGGEFHERPGQAGFGPLPGVVGARVGTLTFAVELHGSGTAESDGGESVPTWAKMLLPACGVIQTGATSPIFHVSSTSPSDGATALAVRTLTMGLYTDGVLKRIHGAMGTCVIRCVNGQPVRLEFTFTGAWDAPTDVALLAPTYPTVIPPRWGGGAFTLDSYALVAGELSVDLGNEVVMRPDAAQAAGLATAIITGRRILGTVNPESRLVAERDNYGIWLAGTEGALSVVVGATAGNKCTLGAPKAQVSNIQEIDRDGVQAEELTLQFNRSAAAGDDEFTMTFG